MNKDQIKQKISDILRQHGITDAYFFGSINSDQFNQNSDVDILYRQPKSKILSILDIIGVKLEIEDTIGRNVDLVEYDYVKPALKKYIYADPQPIYN